MNLNQLKYFNAVAEQGSVSKAAKLLSISQPSLSAAIKELEEEFGIALFSRHYRGVTLTREGTAFYKMSADILKNTEKCEAAMLDMGKGRKILRLGVPPMIGSVILPLVYNGFLKKNNDIVLETAEGGYSELLERLSDEKIDLAFLPHTSSLPSVFDSVLLGEIEIVCAVAKDHPLCKKDTINPETLASHPLVLFETGFFQSKSILDWFCQKGVAPHIMFRTEQLSTVISMIRKSDAIGFLYSFLAADHPDISFLSTEKPMTLAVSLVWRRDSHLGNTVKRFIAFAKEQKIF